MDRDRETEKEPETQSSPSPPRKLPSTSSQCSEVLRLCYSVMGLSSANENMVMSPKQRKFFLFQRPLDNLRFIK